MYNLEDIVVNNEMLVKKLLSGDNVSKIKLIDRIKKKRILINFDYSKILLDDIMYSGSYKKDVPINILERLMYLPFQNIRFFLDKIPTNLLYSMLSNNGASRNYSYIRLIGAAVHAKNKEAISYFDSITKIPSSMFLFEDYLPYEKIDIHTRENFNRLSPAIVAVQNRDIDMLDFLQSFESSGWAGTLTNRFNQPSFIFLHSAIKECDFETVRFIMDNGIQSLTHFDCDGNTPLDYLSMISEEYYISHKEKYDEMLSYALDKHFNTQGHRKKEMGIKLSSNINNIIMLSLLNIAESLDLPCYIFKNTTLKPLTHNIEYNDFDQRQKKLKAIGEIFKGKNEEWMIYSKNVSFLKKISENIQSYDYDWKDFVSDQGSLLSAPQKKYKFNFYDYKKEIESYYTNNQLVDISLEHLNSEINIEKWVIPNHSLSHNFLDNAPSVKDKVLMNVSLTHLNLALIFSDSDYLKKCLFSLDIEKNKSVYWDIFLSSSIITSHNSQIYLANLLLSDDIMTKNAMYNCFIFDNNTPEKGMVPLVYYSHNKEKLKNINHHLLYKNYILFIKSYLDNPCFNNNEKFCHDISIFNEFNVDAKYMYDTIKNCLEPSYSKMVYYPIFKDNMPKLLNALLVDKMKIKIENIVPKEVLENKITKKRI